MGLKFLGKKTMKGEKSSISRSCSLAWRDWINVFVRFIQFIMAIVVIGLYAQDLAKASKAGKYADGKWVFAVVVATLSCIVSAIFAIPMVAAFAFFFVDVLVWFLWIVLFGIFGKMYIKEDPEGNKGIIRMKHAVWIDLVNMLLWFGTMVFGAIKFWKMRKERSLFTGRAEAHA